MSTVEFSIFRDIIETSRLRYITIPPDTPLEKFFSRLRIIMETLRDAYFERLFRYLLRTAIGSGNELEGILSDTTLLQGKEKKLLTRSIANAFYNGDIETLLEYGEISPMYSVIWWIFRLLAGKVILSRMHINYSYYANGIGYGFLIHITGTTEKRTIQDISVGGGLIVQKNVESNHFELKALGRQMRDVNMVVMITFEGEIPAILPIRSKTEIEGPLLITLVKAHPITPKKPATLMLSIENTGTLVRNIIINISTDTPSWIYRSKFFAINKLSPGEIAMRPLVIYPQNGFPVKVKVSVQYTVNGKKFSVLKEIVLKEQKVVFSGIHLFHAYSSMLIYTSVSEESATFIGGIISAVDSIMTQLTGEKKHVKMIEYDGEKVIVVRGKWSFLVGQMAEGDLSLAMGQLIHLHEEIERKYAPWLSDFKGNLQPFSKIRDLICSHLILKEKKTGK